MDYLNGSNYSLMAFDVHPHIFANTFIRAGLILLYSIIFIICFLANLAVILVVTLQWKRRSVSKFCLGNMAVANFSVSLFCILQHLTLFLVDTWMFGQLLCKMNHFITNLCHAASVLMVVLISIERYVVLLHPIRCRQFLTTRTLVLIILGVWVLSALISLPCFFYSDVNRVQLHKHGDFGDVCMPIESMYNSAAVDTIDFLIMYLIPLIIMSALYLRIGLFLRHRERMRRDYEGHNNASIQDTFPGSHLQSSQKQLEEVNIEGSSLIRKVRSAPEDLGSLSMPSVSTTSTREEFIGQIPPQQVSATSANFLNSEELDKWRRHPTHAVRFESTEKPRVAMNSLFRSYSVEQNMRALEKVCRPHLIPKKKLTRKRNTHCEARRYAIGAFIGDTHRSHSTTTSLSILQRRSAVAVDPEAQRLLYRYKRLRLSRSRCKQRQRVVRMFIFSVITFALLNLPHHLRKLCLHFLPSFDTTSEASKLIASLTYALMYANCAVNPILYAFMSKNFRASLRDFCFGSRRNIVTV